jgi:hypothetical protein
MVRRWVAGAAAVLVVLGVAGCSSDGGSSAATPTITRKAWTPAGLATAKAATDKIAAAIPGQCTDAAASDISRFAFGMQQVHSTIVPVAQVNCTVNTEVVEINVFASTRDRDRFLDDRATGLCRLALAQAEKYKGKLTFPGLRWDVGAGNITLQPDSEAVARQLSVITGGHYDPRGCAKGITMDWDSGAVASLDALGKKVTDSGHGCSPVDLVGRDTIREAATQSNAKLPVALATCPFDTGQIEILTYARSTPAVKTFIAERVKVACAADPASGHIEGDGYSVLAPGTIAEQVHGVVGGTLAATTCTGAAAP